MTCDLASQEDKTNLEGAILAWPKVTWVSGRLTLCWLPGIFQFVPIITANSIPFDFEMGPSWDNKCYDNPSYEHHEATYLPPMSTIFTKSYRHPKKPSVQLTTVFWSFSTQHCTASMRVRRNSLRTGRINQLAEAHLTLCPRAASHLFLVCSWHLVINHLKSQKGSGLSRHRDTCLPPACPALLGLHLST